MSRRTDPAMTVRMTCWDRDGGRCVACGAPAVDLHHRRTRGMGGDQRPDTNLPQNLVCLCRYCHTRVDRAAWGESVGLYLHQSQNPLTVPVQTWQGSRYLTGDGRSLTFEQLRLETSRKRSQAARENRMGRGKKKPGWLKLAEAPIDFTDHAYTRGGVTRWR